MKDIAIAIIALALLPLLFKLLIKLRLGILLLYLALASTVFAQWSQANQTLSMVILYALLAAVVISWLWPPLRRWRENWAMNSLIKNQLRQARAAGADSLKVDVIDGIPMVRGN